MKKLLSNVYHSNRIKLLNRDNIIQCWLCNNEKKLGEHKLIASNYFSAEGLIKTYNLAKASYSDIKFLMLNNLANIYVRCSNCSGTIKLLQVGVTDHYFHGVYLTQLNSFKDCYDLILLDIRYRYIIPYKFLNMPEFQLLIKLTE
jgi:hypothetical protein